MGILRKAGGAFSSILKDPVGFCGNLVGAVRGGCQKFSGNAATHLKNGLTGWLFGALAGAGLTLPAQFDTKGIVSVVLQVLGATYERLRGKLANKIGAQNVGRLEKTFDFLTTIVTGGLGTAWHKISEFAGNLQEMVIGGIKEWVMQSVITSAITKLVSMFNPAGAIIQAAMAIYNTVMFFIERGSQIAALAEAVFNSIGTIAAGNVAGAANYVEQTMGRSLPVMISFLARLLGLGGISEHIKNVIKKIQTPIENAMNKLAAFIVEKGKSLLGKDGKTAQPSGTTTQQNTASNPEDKTKGDPHQRLKEGLAELEQKLDMTAKQGLSPKESQSIVASVKANYGFQILEIVDSGDELILEGKINPEKKKKTNLRELKEVKKETRREFRLVENPADRFPRDIALAIDATQASITALNSPTSTYGDGSTAYGAIAEQVLGSAKARNFDAPAETLPGLGGTLHEGKCQQYIKEGGGLRKHIDKLPDRAKAIVNQEITKMEEAIQWCQNYRAGKYPLLPSWAKPYKSDLKSLGLKENGEVF
jgi:hypothetical protein